MKSFASTETADQCPCCDQHLDVRAVWPDGAVTMVDQQTKQRFLALYGAPLVFKFEDIS